jgi:hypothetical protein
VVVRRRRSNRHGSGSTDRLGDVLDRELAGVAVVLHDGRVPASRATVDHVVVGPGGVWIVEANRSTGRVERRSPDGRRASDVRLFVDGRDQTKLAGSVAPHVATIRAMLDPIGFGEAPLHAVVCFTSADWGWFARPFRVLGTTVTSPAGLVQAVRADGNWNHNVIDIIAGHLGASLRASAGVAAR